MDVFGSLVSVTVFVLDCKFHTQHHLVYHVLPELELHHHSRIHSQIGGVEDELFQTALPGGGSVHLALPTRGKCGRNREGPQSMGWNCLGHDSVRDLGAAVRSRRGFCPQMLPQV